MPDAEPAGLGPHLTISSLTAERRDAWDDFVRASDQGSFFHLSGWKCVFEDALRFKTHFLMAEQDGRVRGLLPMVEQNSLLFGHGLIAAPFCVEGGSIGDAAACEALDGAARDLMTRRGARYIEYRSRRAVRDGWQVKRGQYATFARSLSQDDHSNLTAIPRKQRAVVRKALSSGLSAAIDTDPNRLYPVYARSVHNLGTPVFARRYFEKLCEVFRGHCDVVVISDADAPVSAVLNFYFRDTVLPYYGGGTHAARRSGANDLLYWEVMRRAAARGFSRFDFGRSKVGSGAFAFKANWGFEPDWLEYEYWLADGARLPDNNSASPKYKMLVNGWKRLPNAVADFVGPFLVRQLN